MPRNVDYLHVDARYESHVGNIRCVRRENHDHGLLVQNSASGGACNLHTRAANVSWLPFTNASFSLWNRAISVSTIIKISVKPDSFLINQNLIQIFYPNDFGLYVIDSICFASFLNLKILNYKFNEKFKEI